MYKKKLAAALALMMAFSAAAFTSCGSSEETSDEAIEDEYFERQMDPDYENDNDFDEPKYEVEDDGAEVVKVVHPVEDFIGLWDATSNRSAYMYGNVNLNIKEDGTWKGNITEEDFHGKWTYNNGELVIKDSEGVIDFTLFYDDAGYMVFVNNEVPEDPYVLEAHK